MSKRQQRDRIARRRAHAVLAGGGAAVLASLGTAGTAQAANTYTVSNLNDSGTGSLRAAIASVNADTADTAPPGDSIVFASGLSGTISLTSADTSSSALYIKRPVEIHGPGANRLTVRNDVADRGVIALDAVSGVTSMAAKLSGITVTGGSLSTLAGAGINTLSDMVLELDGVTVTGNTAYGWAGVDADISTLTMNGSTVSGNTSTNRGSGGVYAFFGGTIEDSTITGNAGFDGAGISAPNGNLQIAGSTITNNTPENPNAGQVAVSGSGDALTLLDSIVSGSGSVPDVAVTSGATGSAFYSLVRNRVAVSGGTQVAVDSSDKVGVDPKLAGLAFNGGPTETMAPLPSSPVLDQGRAFGLSIDQRGLSRPFPLPTITHVPTGGDRSDIGAVEEHTALVSALSPIAGGPGTRVAITGTGFSGATRVLFGKTPARSFTVLSDSMIVALAPGHAGGTDVRVITPLGESPAVSADRFSEPNVVHHTHAKRKHRTLDSGLKLVCPAGGQRCSARVIAKLHGKQIGKRKITNLRAGDSQELTLKLSLKSLLKLSHGHHKLKLTIHITDGTSRPIAIHKTIKL